MTAPWAPGRWLGAVVALALIAGACNNGSPAATRSHQGPAPATTSPARSLRVSVQRIGRLPAPLQDPAVASVGRSAYALGGLDAADSSVSTVLEVLAGRVRSIGQLSLPTHDAAAAALGGNVYLFGGGHLTSYRTIEKIDPATGSVTTVAQLPEPLSDVSAAVIGTTAYIVGGYTGASFSDQILSFSKGVVRVAGHLPIGLRYTAVAAADGSLVIAGGLSVSGPTRAIYRFTPATHRLTKIGTLPRPLMHASAAALGGAMYIVGGLGRRLIPRRDILAVRMDGAVTRAGSLPQPLSDAGVSAQNGRIVVIGGRNRSGPVSSVLAIVPAP